MTSGLDVFLTRDYAKELKIWFERRLATLENEKNKITPGTATFFILCGKIEILKEIIKEME